MNSASLDKAVSRISTGDIISRGIKNAPSTISIGNEEYFHRHKRHHLKNTKKPESAAPSSINRPRLYQVARPMSAIAPSSVTSNGARRRRRTPHLHSECGPLAPKLLRSRTVLVKDIDAESQNSRKPVGNDDFDVKLNHSEFIIHLRFVVDVIIILAVCLYEAGVMLKELTRVANRFEALALCLVDDSVLSDTLASATELGSNPRPA
ncbi:hypothetical protein EVAR_2639_1 [Eumeta japonica]|uniref:Uncharacterized protein n=1 Tax=Eumeta variegata TaxID=151549 RepID=A0A4C1SPT6_EUMVA|nr:hypothetical protein EVAR_2639_1 [Eumeta japonica]